MKYFTIEQRETLERQLNARALLLRDEIDGYLGHGGEGTQLAKRHDGIEPEALAALGQSLDVAAIERDIRELNQVRRALKRLHSPEYGTCEACGADIPYVRLNSQPMATLCARCQAVLEADAGASRLG